MRTSSEGETGSLKQQTAGNFPIIFLKLKMFPLKNSNPPWVIVQLQSWCDVHGIKRKRLVNSLQIHKTLLKNFYFQNVNVKV